MARKAPSSKQLEFAINSGVVASYRRLSYTAWHALAEFVDNSTQSFFDNRKQLSKVAKSGEPPLEVSITYERDAKNGKGLLRIVDNAMGMDESDLRNAMVVGLEPDANAGRSEYGMGMKTAAFWTGNNLSIRTTKLGSDTEFQVELSLDRLIRGELDLPIRTKSSEKESHYTIIEVSDLAHRWVGQTLGKIKTYLRSMYRVDIRDGVLSLKWQGEELDWDLSDLELYKAKDNTPYRRDFSFKLDSGREVRGWAGVLDKGSRAKAGFTIIRRGRVIAGWPDSWKPTTIYGEQVGGSNTLVSQRLFGEVELDEFVVTHTKDKIIFQDSEEEDLEKRLADEVKELIQIAKERRKKDSDDRGPSDIEVKDAVNTLKGEIETPQMADTVAIQSGIAPEQAEEVFTALIKTVDISEPTMTTNLMNLQVDVWISEESSMNDPYVAVDSAQSERVMVIVNTAHPHWAELEGENSVLNYLRECTYDAIAEWQTRRQSSAIEPNTVKLYKDKLLRVKFEHDNQPVRGAPADGGSAAARKPPSRKNGKAASRRKSSASRKAKPRSTKTSGRKRPAGKKPAR